MYGIAKLDECIAPARHLYQDDQGDEKACRIGTHRVVAPEVTLERVRKFLPGCGISRLADVTGLDRLGIPVVMAIRPMSRSISAHQGKGTTLAAAKASAAMEALESWHAQHILLPGRRGTWAEMSADTCVLDLNAYGVQGEDSVARWKELDWLKGRDLMSGSETWVPRQLVHTDFIAPLEIPTWPTTSNGLASGNTLDEAVCAALCEVIERDAIAQFQPTDAAQKALLRVESASVFDSVCSDLIDRIRRSGTKIQLWDITSDIGVPAFCCRIYDYSRDRRPVLPANLGYGCHLDPEVALARAITEAAQARLTVIAGVRDDICPSEYQSPRDGNEGYLMEEAYAHAVEGRDFSTHRDLSTASFAGDRQVLLERLAAAGLRQAVMLDLTQADFRIPVVRLVVPGLGRTRRDGRFALCRYHRPEDAGATVP